MIFHSVEPVDMLNELLLNQAFSKIELAKLIHSSVEDINATISQKSRQVIITLLEENQIARLEKIYMRLYVYDQAKRGG